MFVGERSSFALDDYDYNEELQQDDMLGQWIEHNFKWERCNIINAHFYFYATWLAEFIQFP